MPALRPAGHGLHGGAGRAIPTRPYNPAPP